MTEGNDHGPNLSDNARARAVAALRSMEALREFFDQKLAQFMESDGAPGDAAADLLKQQADLAKAVRTAVEQAARLDDATRTERGGGGLDLDAARSEIWRRLDSIRRAGGT